MKAGLPGEVKLHAPKNPVIPRPERSGEPGPRGTPHSLNLLGPGSALRPPGMTWIFELWIANRRVTNHFANHCTLQLR
jgi:hypothetical protein